MLGEITIHDIDRTSRLGKRKPDNNVTGPIIVKCEGIRFAVAFSKLEKNLRVLQKVFQRRE